MTRRSVLVARGAAAAMLSTLVALAVAGPAAAAPGYPGPRGRCVDTSGVLGPAMCDRITRILLADERSSTDEIAVAVVPTTGDDTIEAWSTGLFNHWGVGKAEENNGVLLVVAVDDRRVRLETGRGLTTRLPDSATRQIVDDVITPRFAEDAYATGILNGLDQVRRRLGHRVGTSTLAALAPPRSTDAVSEPAVSEPADSQVEDATQVVADGGIAADDDSSSGAGGWVIAGFAGLILIVMVATVDSSGRSPGRPSGPSTRRVSAGAGRRHRPHNHHSGWMGGSFGGDSGSSSGSSSSFGGGSSDGGGSSGSW